MRQPPQWNNVASCLTCHSAALFVTITTNDCSKWSDVLSSWCFAEVLSTCWYVLTRKGTSAFALLLWCPMEVTREKEKEKKRGEMQVSFKSFSVFPVWVFTVVLYCQFCFDSFVLSKAKWACPLEQGFLWLLALLYICWKVGKHLKSTQKSAQFKWCF